jgi:hypothetical protein
MKHLDRLLMTLILCFVLSCSGTLAVVSTVRAANLGTEHTNTRQRPRDCESDRLLSVICLCSRGIRPSFA